MAIEGTISSVSSAAVNHTVSNTVKSMSESEAKDISIQSGQQAAAGVGAAVISRAQMDEGKAFTGDDRDKDGQKQPSERTIKQVVSDMNRKLNNNTLAEFGYHEETNRVTIKIVDKDTKEVVKEFPPEKTLDLIAKAWEIAGILVDEKK